MLIKKMVVKTIQSQKIQRHLDSKAVSSLFELLGFCRAGRNTKGGLVDFVGFCDNPLDALRRSYNCRAIVDVPLCRMVDLGPVFPSISSNPYYLTARQYADDSSLTYRDSALKIYYEAFIPSCAAELLEVQAASLKDMSPIEAAVPWVTVSGPGVRNKRVRRSLRHSKKMGMPLSPEDGDYSIGPFSQAKGEMEFERLAQVVDSIRDVGYQPSSPFANIVCNVYERDGDWMLLVKSGTHRVAALKALGYERVPVIVNNKKMVRVEDVRSWPGVVSGHFSESEARNLFERVFAGEDPGWLSRLIEKSDSYRSIRDKYLN